MSLSVSSIGMKEIPNTNCQTFTSTGKNSDFYYVFISTIDIENEIYKITLRPINYERDVRENSKSIILNGLLAIISNVAGRIFLNLHESKAEYISETSNFILDQNDSKTTLTNLEACRFYDNENYLKVASNFNSFLKSKTINTDQNDRNTRSTTKKDNCVIL